MQTIQLRLDTKLREAIDLAKRQRVNRSAFIRGALREHLNLLRERNLQEQDRRGYLTHPQRKEEFRPWEDIAAWPEQ